METLVIPMAESPCANSGVTSSGLTSIDTSHPGASPLWARSASTTEPSSRGASRDGVPPPKATASSDSHPGSLSNSVNRAATYRSADPSSPVTTAKSQ